MPTPQIEQRIINDYRNPAIAASAVCKRHKITWPTLYAVLRRHNVPLRRPNRVPTHPSASGTRPTRRGGSADLLQQFGIDPRQVHPGTTVTVTPHETRIVTRDPELARYVLAIVEEHFARVTA